MYCLSTHFNIGNSKEEMYFGTREGIGGKGERTGGMRTWGTQAGPPVSFLAFLAQRETSR